MLSISGGRDLTLYEVDEAASRVRQEVDPEANIIVGATFDEQLGDRLRVSIVASGMNRMAEQLSAPKGSDRLPPRQRPHGGYGANSRQIQIPMPPAFTRPRGAAIGAGAATSG